MGFLSGGDFGNYAGALAAGLAIAAYCLRSRFAAEVRWIPRWALLGILLAGSVGGFLISIWSGNRTALITYLVTLCVCSPLLLQSVRRSVLLYVVAVGAVAALFVALPDLRDRVMLGVNEVRAYWSAEHPEARNTSMGIRLDSLILGLDICSAHPLAGIGIVHFKELASKLAAEGAIAAVIPAGTGLLGYRNTFVQPEHMPQLAETVEAE